MQDHDEPISTRRTPATVRLFRFCTFITKHLISLKGNLGDFHDPRWAIDRITYRLRVEMEFLRSFATKLTGDFVSPEAEDAESLELMIETACGPNYTEYLDFLASITSELEKIADLVWANYGDVSF